LDKSLLREFFIQLNKLEEREYFLSMVAYGTAPTQKGMKPSSLMSFSKKGRNLFQLWEKYKYEVGAVLNLDFFILKETSDHRLILFYNSGKLKKHIFSRESREFLKMIGYKECMTLDQSLQLLKIRFEGICPHEIGVFLGIPIEDILGFIKHKGDKCLFCSYWKVYHNPESARALFKCYDIAKINVIYSIINVDAFGRATVEAS